LKPGAFKLCVNYVQLVQPHRSALHSASLRAKLCLWFSRVSALFSSRSFKAASSFPSSAALASRSATSRLRYHFVAVQIEFERQILKAVFHLIGAWVETTWVPGAFQLWVRGSQRALAHRLLVEMSSRRRAVSSRSTPTGACTASTNESSASGAT
jgi:hypothetical protein